MLSSTWIKSGRLLSDSYNNNSQIYADLGKDFPGAQAIDGTGSRIGWDMLALIVACAKNIAHADTCFNGLGSIRHLYIGEVIERHGMIVAVINLIDPLYLPVSGHIESL